MAISRFDGFYPVATPDPYGYPLVPVPGGAVTINPGDNVATVMAANPPGTDYFFADGTFSTGLSGIVIQDGDRWFANPQAVTLDGTAYSGVKVIDLPASVNLEVYYLRFANWTVTSDHSSNIDARDDGWDDDPEVGGNHPRWNTTPGSLLLYGCEASNHTDSSPGGLGHLIQLGQNGTMVGGSYTGGASSGLCLNGHGPGIVLDGVVFTDWRGNASGHHGICKLVKVHGTTIRRCKFDNSANTVGNTLLWLDVDAYDILIEYNEFVNQRGYAIHMELGSVAKIRCNQFTDTGNTTNSYWGWNGSILVACYEDLVIESNVYDNCYGAVLLIDQSAERNWGDEYCNGTKNWTWDTRENGLSPAPLNVVGGDGKWGPSTGTGPGPGGTNYRTADWVPIWGRRPTSADGSPTADFIDEYATGGATIRNNTMNNCARTSAGNHAVPTIGARADNIGFHGSTDSRAYKLGAGQNNVYGNAYTGTNNVRWYTGWASNPNYDNVGDASMTLATAQSSLGFDPVGSRTVQTAVAI